MMNAAGSSRVSAAVDERLPPPSQTQCPCCCPWGATSVRPLPARRSRPSKSCNLLFESVRPREEQMFRVPEPYSRLGLDSRPGQSDSNLAPGHRGTRRAVTAEMALFDPSQPQVKVKWLAIRTLPRMLAESTMVYSTASDDRNAIPCEAGAESGDPRLRGGEVGIRTAGATRA
jgi:hypothetical protein